MNFLNSNEIWSNYHYLEFVFKFNSKSNEWKNDSYGVFAVSVESYT